MKRDEATLLDIARSARLVLESREGLDKAVFLRDVKTQSAVLHQLLIMGEAVKRLSTGYRSGHPEIPWTLIAGMRDQLVHGYDIVDLDEVWKTADQDVPELLTWLDPRLPQQSQPTFSRAPTSSQELPNHVSPFTHHASNPNNLVLPSQV